MKGRGSPSSKGKRSEKHLNNTLSPAIGGERNTGQIINTAARAK
ncbi:MAG: hypothetical protein Q7R98_03810 [Candidatus Jorgensenbacteria bacterium]|nr:hypothetical protein [Candidatus Jorgensenbacteria bacterium]